MASTHPAAEPAVTSPSVEQTTDGVNSIKLDDQTTAAVEPQQELHAEKPQEGESQLARLHRLCAEGEVMGIRAILSQGLDLLESIGKSLIPLDECVYNRWLVAAHRLCPHTTPAVKSRGRIGQARSKECERETTRAAFENWMSSATS